METKNEINLRMHYKGVEIDERTEEYIKKRIQKAEQFLTRAMEYEVEIARDKKGKFCLEVMIKTPYKLYRAEELTGTIEEGIDLAVEDLRTQIKKDKDKMRDLRKRGARSIKKKKVIAEVARF
jgi:ribosomal subunit interface protein